MYKIYRLKDLIIINDKKQAKKALMNNNIDFVVLIKDNKYVGYIKADNMEVIKDIIYNRDTIIPVVKKGKLKYIKRIYSKKYVQRKKDYYVLLKKLIKEYPEYLDNYKNVIILGNNKFTRLLNKHMDSKIIKYGDKFKKGSYVITSNLYKYNLYNGISVKKFIKQYNNSYQLKNNKILVNNYIDSLDKQGVYTIKVKVPTKLDNITKLEQIRINSGITPNNKEIDVKHIKDLYDNVDYFNEFHKEFLNRPSMIQCGDLLQFIDYKSKYINIENGERKTLYHKSNYVNNIYLIGSCIVNGHYAEDKDTIASLLQKKLVNYNVHSFGGSGNKWNYYIKILDYLELRKGDIVILIDESDLFNKIDIDLTNEFNKLHKKCSFYWDRPMHCNNRGYKVVSNTLYKYINNNCKLDGKLIKSDTREVNKLANNLEFNKYIKHISKYKSKCNRIGSIVMNCNPFTNGHMYLIEQALKQVDYLYIFVVQENKSYYTFKDRFKMVKLGTKKYKNIKVIPSGKFIISSLTFNEYFNKDNNQDCIIDTSYDTDIFGKYICKALNIKYRFVGTEPLDKITNQYNIQLKNNLLKYNVELVEIERLKYSNDIVNATYVRKLVKEGKMDMIKKYVPYTTYKIIGGKYVRRNNIK